MACGLSVNRPKCTRSSSARETELRKESSVEEAHVIVRMRETKAKPFGGF